MTTLESNLPAVRRALAARYDIREPIGRGGMGFVYLARELRLDRPVAVKLLPPALAADEACRQRFLREARTAAQLAHPNIVPIYAVHEMGDFVFFTMAYVAGETLAHRVETGGPLGHDAAGRLLTEVGEALAYAHERGVVHRDVKPDNILIESATGRALLSDFGIAHASAGEGKRATAPRGPVLGTAAFISPEQARGELVDVRSDVYSFGVVAFYALSGRLPFDATSDRALLLLHITEPAPPLRSVAPGVPPRLAQVVDRCLAKDPWARFRDAPALLRALAEAVEPPRAPLAVRAFLLRGVNRALMGLLLLPVAALSWLYSNDPALHAAAAAGLGAALLLPAALAIARVRRLLAAGYGHHDLVTALVAERARRREELSFMYGAAPSGFEHAVRWLAWMAILVVTAWVWLSPPEAPRETGVAAAGVALLAAIVARARTEQRTDPRGARRLWFWRGPLGRGLFRLAGLGLRRPPYIVTILGRLETPA
ncbi:MAG: serine/threonine-protein kinase [Gemmatimonadales bacterium]